MEKAAAVAEQPVRDHLDEVAERQPLQHRAAQRDLPAVLEHAHLAPVLGLVRRRRLLERLRRRLVDRAAPGLHHPVREGEVVAPLRVDLDVVGPAHRVDRAVAAGDRTEPRLGLALRQLVAPVEALLVRAVGGLEHEPPADVGDIRVGEVGDELPKRVGCPGRVRVGEGEDLAAGLAHGPVLGGDLAAARVHDQPHAVSEALDQLVRAVGRGVGGDDDLELVGRIVEREQVLEPPLDHRLLVVGGDDHGHVRLDRLLADAPRANARECGGAERVDACVHSERAQREPEEELEHQHGPSVEPTVGSPACRLASALSSARGRTS